ncbi:MAG: hypothetical protein UW64_C0006G0001, partial [Microgenomates group bacterium GW2011_GWC1_44_37]
MGGYDLYYDEYMSGRYRTSKEKNRS